jgi:hypothetical protein
MIALFFLVVKPLGNSYMRGDYFNLKLYENMTDQLVSSILVWPLFFVW